MKNLIQCKYDELYQYHFGLGLWIRNNLLKMNGELFQMLAEEGFSQKDEMSSFLTEQFYIYKQVNETLKNSGRLGLGFFAPHPFDDTEKRS